MPRILPLCLFILTAVVTVFCSDRSTSHLSEDEINSLIVEALDALTRSDITVAEEKYLQAAEAAEKLQNGKLLYADIIAKMGSLEYEKGDTERAMELLHRAEDIVKREAPESMNAASIYGTLGYIHGVSGDFEKEEEFLQKALRIQEKLEPGSPAVSTTYANLGFAAFSKGNLDSAERYLLKALELDEINSPESLVLASTLNNLGSVSAQRGELDKAEDYYQRAYLIRNSITPETLETAISLNNLGFILAEKGDLSIAEERYQEALAILVLSGDYAANEALLYNNLACIAADRGFMDKAEESYLHALEIQEKIAPSSLDSATYLTNLSTVAFARMDFESAEDYCLKALNIHEKLVPGSVTAAVSYNNIAMLLYKKGDLEGALKYNQKALEIRETLAPDSLHLAISYGNLGRVYLKQGELEKAMELFAKSLDIYKLIAPRSLNEAIGYSLMGEATALAKNNTKAEEMFLKALEIRNRFSQGTTELAETHYALGTLYRNKGKNDISLRYLAGAVDQLEQQKEKLGGSSSAGEKFSASFADYYRDLIEVQVELGMESDAFRTLERFRARSLLEMLAEKDLDFAKDAPAELLKRQKELVKQESDIRDAISELIADNTSDMEALQAELRDLKRKQTENQERIKKSSPKLASLKYPASLSADETLSILNKDTLFLSYCAGKSETLLFVLFNGKMDLFRIPIEREDLQIRISRFRKMITSQSVDLSRIKKESVEFYRLLLKSAGHYLKKAEKVIICPDGPLHCLPFSALMTGKRGHIAGEKSIVYVISATVLNELNKQRALEDTGIAAFGDPDYSAAQAGDYVVRSVLENNPLTPLPATGREVDAIGRLFGEKSTVFKKDEATEENAKRVDPGTGILHFACHGILDERFPLDSGLALAIPEKTEKGSENGLLQAWEIFEDMRINAELVTLSACETALGAEMGGEGLIGLTRAFQYAGAKSVLSTLWSVPDESTAILMEYFYSKIKKGVSAPDALAAAQKKMIRSEKYTHPFYWAGFVLNGESR